MKTITTDKPALLKDIVMAKNPDLDKLLGDRIFFPDKNEQAEEQLAKHGLPKELVEKQSADH